MGKKIQGENIKISTLALIGSSYSNETRASLPLEPLTATIDYRYQAMSKQCLDLPLGTGFVNM